MNIKTSHAGTCTIADLDATAETLLIPLSASVLAPQLNPDLDFQDPIAEALFARLQADPQRFVADKASGPHNRSVVRERQDQIPY